MSRKRMMSTVFQSKFCCPVDPSHVLIEFALTFLLSLHHCPSAVCSSHFHLAPTFPSVFCRCYWEDSRSRKMPPVVWLLNDNTSLNSKTLGSCLATGSKLFCLDVVIDRDKRFVVTTGLDYFKYAQLSEPLQPGYVPVSQSDCQFDSSIPRQLLY